VPDGLILAISQKEVKEKIKTALLPRNQPELSKVNESDSHDKEKSVVQITDVKFENNEDTSRVLITALDKVEYDLTKSYDGKTLALIVKDAFLPENLQRTVDTSMLKGPAQRVSSFMSAGKTDNKAMIVVRLKEEVPYEVSQVDNLLALSFPKQQSEKSQDGDNALSAKAGNETEKIAAKSSQLLKPNDSGEGKKEAQEIKSKTAAVTPATVEKKSAAINKAKAEKDKIVSVKPLEKLASSNAENLENEAVKKPKKVIKTVTKKVSKKRKYVGRKISLDFKDADIKNILRLIAEVSNLNIVAGDDVKGKVTLRLLKVPWDQALELVLKSKSLGMVKEGNVIRIAPMAKIAAEKKMILDNKKSEEKLEDLAVKIIPVNYSSASELTEQVKNLLSDRGNVSVDSRTNVLIVKDIKDNIEEAEALVQMLDAPTPQVLIEARIVEAQRNFAKDLGVEWGLAGGEVGSDSFGTVFGNTNKQPSNRLLPSGYIPGQFSEQPNFAVSLPASGSAGSLGGIGFTFGKLTGDPWLIDLRLSAGEVSGLSKVISRPRVIALDNTEARISQGDSVPFQTISDGGINTEFIDATLDLTVTPHITPDGSVFMKMKVSRNSIGTFRSATGTPSISKKEASTEIMIKDGETAVIGGIVVSDESDGTSGIPYFKNIRGLGWLFKRNSIADTQTELLIFITPKIIKDTKSG
jgi:type IV pilus secretin PilQ/predicted competence protein